MVGGVESHYDPIDVNETRRPHTVPDFHLRRFGSGPANQSIWVYDKQKDLIFPGTVSTAISKSPSAATKSPHP